MKTKSFIQLGITLLMVGIVFSCNKKEDEFTIENQPVSGDFAYSMTSYDTIQVDPATHQVLIARIGVAGPGNISNMGNLTMASTFTFNFVTGQGTDFVTTYTGSFAGDSFSSNGTSQMQLDGTITMIETFSNGKGKFSKISGGGETIVTFLTPDGSSLAGTSNWTLTY